MGRAFAGDGGGGEGERREADGRRGGGPGERVTPHGACLLESAKDGASSTGMPGRRSRDLSPRAGVSGAAETTAPGRAVDP
ncbi:hypothetical protein Sfulv_02430 [Streptomyces fulvorobeus]|uniref:Uncharacterized protein n=1 Tax=Streptomyces fulvorobeus TaxID=284028 RepID=A0A7J0BYW6_9ACTN|nr:hypothetical protein Sfulv_02430 [Streptomyces fulvorobeus]